MCEDVFREAGIEIKGSKAADKEIGKIYCMFKNLLKISSSKRN
jgi:hypothetical protein